MRHYLIGHDLGTSGNKATLYTDEGRLLKSVLKPYETHMTGLGEAEQNPEDWWQSVCLGTRELMQGLDPKEVAGISFSGQMMGCVCLDQAGTLLGNSMIWADTRAQAECDQLLAQCGMEKICSVSGMRPAPNYTLEKLMWLKKHRPDFYKKIHVVLQSKDYIIYRMTGRLCTDRTDASCTQAYDIRTNTWSDELIQAAGIDQAVFPQVVDSTEVVGTLTAPAAAELGLNTGTPVVAGAGDGLCAAIGAGSILPGKGYCCLGSSSWISCSTDRVLNNSRGVVMYGPHVIPHRYCLAGTMQAGTLSYNWAKKSILPELSMDDVNQKIAATPIGSNGVIFLPYLLGERSPWWNSSLRGSFLGLSMDTSPADMMRAVVEGVGMNLYLIFQEISRYETIQELNLIGGGAKADIWRQTLSDIFQVPVYKLAASDEGSSFGAIMIAGVGLGIFPDFSSVTGLITRACVNEPVPQNHARYMEVFERFCRAYRASEPYYSGTALE